MQELIVEEMDSKEDILFPRKTKLMDLRVINATMRKRKKKFIGDFGFIFNYCKRKNRFAKECML